jgi:hypothetical protein
VTEAVAVAGALVAWLGAATIGVSDGRRGMALGLAMAAAGLAAATYPKGGLAAAVALVVGGLGAATLRLRAGPPGWAIMPPGSTPRIILGLMSLAAGGLVGIWLTTGPYVPARVAVLTVCVLSLARVWTAERRVGALASASALAMALGTIGGLGAVATGAAVAVVLAALPASERRVPDLSEPAEAGG